MTTNHLPVLIIGFNRPDYVKGLLQHLAKCQPLPDTIYFAVDGPRANNATDAENVLAVQRLASTIPWTCEIKTFFRSENRGCKLGVYEAIS